MTCHCPPEKIRHGGHCRDRLIAGTTYLSWVWFTVGRFGNLPIGRQVREIRFRHDIDKVYAKQLFFYFRTTTLNRERNLLIQRFLVSIENAKNVNISVIKGVENNIGKTLQNFVPHVLVGKRR